MKVQVNIFATIDQDEVDLIKSYGCNLEAPRNEDGTIGPHVTGFITSNNPDEYMAGMDIKAVLEELDVVMTRL